MLDLENLFGEGDEANTVETKGSRHTTQQAPHQKRPELGFVGLINQGATCYLNSMLQMLYMTPELRDGIYKLPPDTLDVQTQDESTTNTKQSSTDDFSDLPALIDCDPSPTPHAAAVPASIDLGLLEGYLAMGFEESLVRKALAKFRLESEILDWLLSGEAEAEPENTLEEIGPLFPVDEPASVQVDPALLTQKIMDYSNATKETQENNTASTATTTQAEESPANWWQTQLESNQEDFNAVELKEIVTSSTIQIPTEVKSETDKKEEKKRDGKKRFLYSLQRLFAHMQKSDMSALATDQITSSFGWSGSETLQQHDVHELFRLFFDAIERSLLAVRSTNLINELYRGEFVNQVKCLSCGYTSTRPEDFHDVSVVVKGFDSLNDSLASYVSEEALTGDNRYHCEKCATKVDAKRGQKFRSLPPFLMFALQRFEYDWQHDKRIKITSNYSFPLVLDMAPYLDTAEEQPNEKGKKAETIPLDDGIVQPAFDVTSPHLYELFAIIIHQGGAYGGHYHAYVRNVMDRTTPPTSMNPKETSAEPALNEPQNTTSTTTTTTTTTTQTPTTDPTTTLNTEPVYFTQIDHVNTAQTTSSSSSSSSTSASFPSAPFPPSSSTQSPSSPSPPSSSNPASSTGYSLEKLLQEPWYDFDDTKVTQLHTGCVSSQYGGKTECAYMLVYRKVALASKTYVSPPVPEHLSQEIAKNNITLNEERISYDQALYTLNIGVRFLNNYDIKEGGMIEKPIEPTLDAEEKPSIEADLRDNVEDLRKRIATQFAKDVPAVDKLVLQEITSRSGWLKLGQPLRDNTTLKQAGLRDGTTIIAWAGQDSLGVNMEGAPITVDVLYYYGTQDPIEFQVHIAEQATLKKLKEAVSLKTEIPEDHMSLCKVGTSNVIPLHNLDDTTPLGVAQISDRSTITVESLPEGTASYAVEHLSKLLEVFVLDQMGEIPVNQTPVSVRIEKDATVVELKQKCLNSLKSSVAIDKCHMRRTQSLGFPGTIIGNEKNSLAAAGIQGGQLLILELGEPQNQDFLTIRFTVDLGDYPRNYHINVPRKTTVVDCKIKMLQLLDSTVPPPNSRLRKTDMISEAASDIISDETRTLEETGVQHDDLLVLEIGKSIAKGSIILHAQLYLPPVLVSKSNVPESRPPENTKPVVLADELANSLAAVMINSPHIGRKSHPPVDLSSDVMLANLIPANLLPSSLVLPAPASPASSSTPPVPFATSELATNEPQATTNPVMVSSSSIITDTTTTPSSTTITTSAITTTSTTPTLTPTVSTITITTSTTLNENNAPSSLESTEQPSAPATLIPATVTKPGEQESESNEAELAAFSPALWAFHASKKRGNSTIRLGDVEADCTKTTVEDLKKKLHKLDILSAMPSHQHLRVWAKDKLLKNNAAILKKSYITCDTNIVVQTLTAPDPEESTLLYLHHIDPTIPNAPITPPIEIFVPLLQTVPMLRDYVARALNIPVEHIAIAKYQMSNKVPIWKLLTYDDNVDTERTELIPILGPHSLEARRGRNTRKRANNSKHTLLVKDGDIIGVIDCRASPDSIAYFKKHPPVSHASHSRRHTSFSLSSSPSTSRRSSKPRAPEAVLKINLDWD